MERANEITQPIATRRIDLVLEQNCDKAAVRIEHAIHASALNALGLVAAEASAADLGPIAAWYRQLAIEADRMGANSLMATAARAS